MAKKTPTAESVESLAERACATTVAPENPMERAKALMERARIEEWTDNYRLAPIHAMSRARSDLFDAGRRVERARAALPRTRALATQLDDVRNAFLRVPDDFVSTWRISIGGTRNDPRGFGAAVVASRVAMPAAEIRRALLEAIETARPNVEAAEAALRAAEGRIPGLVQRLEETLAEAERACRAVASPNAAA